MGKEFVNSQFNKLLEHNRIKLYHTYSEIKSAIVERFNRTLNDKFGLHFEINQNYKWLRLLSDILKEYNEKHVHRTIGVPPAMVSKKNEQEIHRRMYSSHFKFEKPTFEEGDRVRITRKNSTFSDKYERKWTTEIFIIRKIHYTEPITYSIKDLDGEEINGKFYKQELQKTKFSLVEKLANGLEWARKMIGKYLMSTFGSERISKWARGSKTISRNFKVILMKIFGFFDFSRLKYIILIKIWGEFLKKFECARKFDKIFISYFPIVSCVFLLYLTIVRPAFIFICIF